MIVWDSREAEEPNARGKLVDAERALAKTRRRIRVQTALAVVLAVFIVGDLVGFVLWPGWFRLVATVLTAGCLAFVLVMRRRFVADFVPGDAERWADARENYDRVFEAEQR